MDSLYQKLFVSGSKIIELAQNIAIKSYYDDDLTEQSFNEPGCNFIIEVCGDFTGNINFAGGVFLNDVTRHGVINCIYLCLVSGCDCNMNKIYADHIVVLGHSEIELVPDAHLLGMLHPYLLSSELAELYPANIIRMASTDISCDIPDALCEITYNERSIIVFINKQHKYYNAVAHLEFGGRIICPSANCIIYECFAHDSSVKKTGSRDLFYILMPILLAIEAA
jgi:hypothetical protein